jgi:hypothetical protein
MGAHEGIRSRVAVACEVTSLTGTCFAYGQPPRTCSDGVSRLRADVHYELSADAFTPDFKDEAARPRG